MADATPDIDWEMLETNLGVDKNDPMMWELFTVLLDEQEDSETLINIKKEITYGNWLEAQHLAHTLKGASANMGLRQVAEDARLVELTCREVAQGLDALKVNEEKEATKKEELEQWFVDRHRKGKIGQKVERGALDKMLQGATLPMADIEAKQKAFNATVAKLVSSWNQFVRWFDENAPENEDEEEDEDAE